MRMRTKKNRDTRLAKVDKYFVKMDDERIDIKNSYAEKLPLWVEIGCGKGTFAIKMSALNKDINYLAFEKVIDVMLMAMEKADREGCGNLKFYNGDAENICELLAEETLERIYINFCDPWPKKRNAKRRLTSPLFLEKYKTLLSNGARIYFKTDNCDLFDYSLEQFIQCGYTVENVCYDLHSSPLNENSVETEYEKNFSSKGFTINYLEAYIKE